MGALGGFMQISILKVRLAFSIAWIRRLAFEIGQKNKDKVLPCPCASNVV
jgi:hypothetical protein